MGEKAIGGYFELENRFESEYYSGLTRLNSGRNCLEYILRAREYEKVFVPSYACTAVMEPIHKLNIAFEYYPINLNLEPVQIPKIEKDEAFLIINYFGLLGGYVNSLNSQNINLIVDNSQAFFEQPIVNVDTFYSARKFFGVPDGAYLSSNVHLQEELPQESSWKRSDYLLRRLENGAKDGYSSFLKNEKYLCGQEIKIMSNFTSSILSGINYKSVITRRNQNFQYIDLKLRGVNRLRLSEKEVNGPMAYPLLVEDGRIRKQLIEQEIFIPTYWPNVLKENSRDSIEYDLANNLLAIPIDQRYGLLDMDRIYNALNSLL